MAKQKNPEDRRRHYVGIKLNDEEYAQLISDMKLYSYNSISRYIRDRILNRKITVKKEVVTDNDIKNNINRLALQISKIGKNYNQVVKKYSASCNMTKNDGSPVINTRATNYYISNLQQLTQKIHEIMKTIIDYYTIKE